MKKIFAAICFLSLVGFGARVYADDTPASIPPVVDEVPLATEETPAPQEEAPPVVSAPVPRESVIVRVGDQVLFSGEVDLPAAGTAMIFSKDGGAHPVNARSVFALISALDQTSDAFSISSIQYYSSFGALYLQCITPNGQGEFCDNWQYVVNGVTPASGMETRVLSGGETIGLYFGSPHRVMLSTTNTTTDTEVVATAEKYNYQDNSWSALSGVSVGVTLPNEADPYNPKVLAVKAVDVHGTASFTLTTPALYKVGIADDYYFPLYDLSISRPIVGGLATNTGPTANKETNTPVFSLDKALVYLQSMQKDDGSFGADMYTDWVAVAYGAHGADKEKLISYLSTKTNTSNSLTDIERRTMALLSLGEDPYVFAGVNYVEKILSSFDGTQFGDPELINDDIFALIPLTASGYTASDEQVTKDTAFLLFKQRSDGSWQGSVDLTAAAVQALAPYKDVAGVSDALTKAGAYLQDSQKVDGGFGSVYSTAWTAQAMHALGEEWKKNGKGVEDYFARVQESDGALLPSSDTNENRIWATSYVIVGKPWNEILRKVAKREVMKPEVRVQEEPNVMAPAIQNTPQIPKIVELTPEISEPAQAVPENILVANAAESGQGIPTAAFVGLIGMVVGFVIKKVWLLF